MSHSSLLSALFVIVTVYAHAQAIEIRPSNPAPRVGEDIIIDFKLQENHPDSLEVVNNPLSNWMVKNMNSVGVVNITISGGHISEPGLFRIGPLQIPVDDKIYTTAKLEIQVWPELPEDVINGIWIRVVKFADNDYIIFEQRQPAEFKEKKNDRGGISQSIGEEDAEWSDIHVDKIERLGIELERKLTSTSVDFLSSGNALYKLAIYTYKPLPSFKGRLTLDRSFIWKPPANCHIEIN